MNYKIILLTVILCTWLICAYINYHNTEFTPIFFFKINNETIAGTERNRKHFSKPMPDQYRNLS